MNTSNHILLTVTSTFAIGDLLLIGLMSVIIGFFVYFAYRYSFKTKVNKYYAASLVGYVPIFAFLNYTFNCDNSIVSLILIITIIICMILVAGKQIAKNQAHQFYLVWSAVLGILCGSGNFIAPSVLCVIVIAILFVFRVIDDDMSRLLTIKASDVHSMEIQSLVFKYFNKKAKLLLKETDDNGNVEFVYRVSIIRLNKLREERIDITELIKSIKGVKTATITNEEVSDE